MATKPLSDAGINIANMVSASRGDIGYMILDTDSAPSKELVSELEKVEGFLKVRVIG
jgi:D-3-phosphoglycerate dehydrogenase